MREGEREGEIWEEEGRWRREEEEEEEEGGFIGWSGGGDLATLRDPDGYSSYKQPSRPNLKSSEPALSVSEISPNSHSIRGLP